MKSLVSLTFAILTLFTFTGCFDVLEEITMKKDGSGVVVYTVNLSQSASVIKPILEKGDYNGNKIPTKDQINKEIEKVRTTIASIKGMSNVRINSNYDKLVFTASGAFDNVETLNKAFNKLAETNKEVKIQRVNNYTFDQSKFSRLNQFQIPANEVSSAKEKGLFSLLNAASYACIYKFENEIQSVSNRNAMVSPNKKSVMMKIKITDFLEGKTNFANDILFQK